MLSAAEYRLLVSSIERSEKRAWELIDEVRADAIADRRKGHSWVAEDEAVQHLFRRDLEKELAQLGDLAQQAGDLDSLAPTLVMLRREFAEACDGERAPRVRRPSALRQSVESLAARARAAEAIKAEKANGVGLAVHVDHAGNVVGVGNDKPVPLHEGPIQLRGNA